MRSIWFRKVIGYERLESRVYLSATTFARRDVFEYRQLFVTDAADLDNDGDVDLVTRGNIPGFGFAYGWLENQDGKGNFAEEEFLIDGSSARPVAADLNNDGFPDLLFADGHRLRWSENRDGTFASTRTIANNFGVDNYRGKFLTFDPDGDRDLDIIALRQNSSLAFHKNLNPDQDFQSRAVTVVSNVNDIAIADLDLDGKSELLVATDQGIESLTIDQETNEFTSEMLVPGTVGQIKTVDFDYDGLPDIVATIQRNGTELVLYRNLGDGRLGLHNILPVEFEYYDHFLVGNFDGNVGIDILTTHAITSPFGPPSIYSHLYSTSPTGFEYSKSQVPMQGLSPDITGFVTGKFVDLNGDGQDDYVIGSRWYANGSNQYQQLRRAIDLSFYHVNHADFDDDGPYIVATTYYDAFKEISTRPIIFERTSVGSFAASYSMPQLSSVYVGDETELSEEDLRSELWIGDHDGDGDLDLALGNYRNETKWLEQSNDEKQFEIAAETVFDEGILNRHIDLLDFDGDGDTDILASSDDLILLRNKGNWEFQSETLWPDHGLVSAELLVDDVDVDGDMDFFLGNQWVKQTDDREFRSVQSIEIGPNSQLVDWDGDFDLDLINLVDQKLVYFRFENERYQQVQQLAQDVLHFEVLDFDSDGHLEIVAMSSSHISLIELSDEFTISRLVRGNFEFIAMTAADFDQDGMMDISDGKNWYQQRVIGDSNDDHVFNSSDLVQVFVSNKYENGVKGAVDFDEGDWNGDGLFNSRDLTFAFQTGNYSLAAISVSDVAAAVEGIEIAFAESPDRKRLDARPTIRNHM